MHRVCELFPASETEGGDEKVELRFVRAPRRLVVIEARSLQGEMLVYALRQTAPDLLVDLVPCLECVDHANNPVLLYDFAHRGCDATVIERALVRLLEICPAANLVILIDAYEDTIRPILNRLCIEHCVSTKAGFAALVTAIRAAVTAVHSKPLALLRALTMETVALPAESSAKPVPVKLTTKEHAILSLIRQGKGNKEIAFTLSCSESTIKVHISNMMRKLQRHSRTQLALLDI